jgi:hypothetical protein
MFYSGVKNKAFVVSDNEIVQKYHRLGVDGRAIVATMVDHYYREGTVPVDYENGFYELVLLLTRTINLGIESTGLPDTIVIKTMDIVTEGGLIIFQMRYTE